MAFGPFLDELNVSKLTDLRGKVSLRGSSGSNFNNMMTGKGLKDLKLRFHWLLDLPKVEPTVENRGQRSWRSVPLWVCHLRNERSFFCFTAIGRLGAES